MKYIKKTGIALVAILMVVSAIGVSGVVATHAGEQYTTSGDITATISNTNGLAGSESVTLLNASNDASVVTETTNSSGVVTFDSIGDGTYYLEVNDASDTTQTSPNITHKYNHTHAEYDTSSPNSITTWASGIHNVDPDGTSAEANNNYTSIANAIDNASDGDHFILAPTTYEVDSVNLTVNNTHFRSAVDNESAFVNGELNATANENVTVVEIDDEVTFADGVLLLEGSGGGGISIGGSLDILNEEFAGIPYVLWFVIVIAVAYVGYEEYKQTR